MKVLYLITRAELGGAQVHLLDLIRGFQDRHEMTVGVGERGFLTEAAETAGVRCEIIRGLVHPMRPREDIHGLVNITKLIRRIRPDLVHAHTTKAGVLGRIAARIAGVPSVFTAHTWCFAEGTSWKWKVVGVPAERLSCRLGSTIITVSEANRRLAVAHRVAGGSRIFTVHNGVPDTPLRAEPDSPGIVRIVMVARFVPQKDQSLLLRAVAKKNLPVRIDFVGDGDTRPKVEALTRELGLMQRVRFLGRRQDIAEILARSHIFALATNWEGFPLSVLEAMRAGLPVVASRVGGTEEAVADGETGYLVDAGDMEAFESRISALVHDSALRGRMGAAGRAKFEREFTVSAMLRKTEEVYDQIVPKREPTTELAHQPLDRSFY